MIKMVFEKNYIAMYVNYIYSCIYLFIYTETKSNLWEKTILYIYIFFFYEKKKNPIRKSQFSLFCYCFFNFSLGLRLSLVKLWILIYAQIRIIIKTSPILWNKRLSIIKWILVRILIHLIVIVIIKWWLIVLA